MLDGTAQKLIGKQLRAVYEHIPKGGIPDQIWKLLLNIEKKFDLRRDEGPGGAERSRSAKPWLY